jgi:ribonuclease PH
MQADGGTRTASVTGAALALHAAFGTLVDQGLVQRNPVRELVAAVSVGLVDGQPHLDLDYSEDSRAQVDLNLVATESGRLVEVQGTAEGDPFARTELDKLLDLAMEGVSSLIRIQTNALSEI